MKNIALIALLAIAACSPNVDDSANDADMAASPGEASPSPDVTPTQAAGSEQDPRILRLEGLGDLTIGEPIPEGSTFAEGGVQAMGSECRLVSSPDYPGVYAIISEGEVRRITVSKDSDVTLIEGIGVGSSEADVRAIFPSFVEEPHFYVDAPAKYLTQPGNDPRLRFETDVNRKVSLIHVGLSPQLRYIEGCA